MTSVDTVLIASPPWADFAFTGLPVGTAACRIYRKHAGSWRLLPGSSQRPVLGTEWRYLDHGLPVSETVGDGVYPGGDVYPGGVYPWVGVGGVEYRLEPLSDAGAVLDAGVLEWSVTAALVGASRGWLSDPLDPLAAVEVTILAEATGEAWGGTGGRVQPPGGMPVALGHTRFRTRPWRLQVDTATDAQKARDWIERGGVLLLRGDPATLSHESGVVYLDIDSPSMRWTNPYDPRRWLVFEAVECAPPAILQLVAARTYADDLAEHPTYADSAAAFSTYLDRMRG